MQTYLENQKGLTLTELMVATAIGLIVSAAVAGLFIQTSASNSQNDEVSYIQDNGRYALKVLADDLEMSNFWAGLSASNRNSIGVDDTSLSIGSSLAVDVDTSYAIDMSADGCAPPTAAVNDNWDYDFAQPLDYMENKQTADVQAVYPCITAIDDYTDVLMVKRTKGYQQTADQETGVPYVRGNRNVATVHKYVDTKTDPPPTGYYDWQYLAHIYYISASTLKRKALGKASSTPETNNPEYSNEEIAAGIERFHIMFGVDSSGDGVADYYTSSPDATELGESVLAKIYILARGEKEVTGYTNDKTYTLGDLDVDPDPDDGYYRRVFNTVVVMKNTQAVLEMD